MFKQATLGTEIMGIAALLIGLAGFIAIIGYTRLSSVVKKVETTDSVNLLVTDIQNIRQQGKEYGNIYGYRSFIF
jgi:hypothetical protein